MFRIREQIREQKHRHEMILIEKAHEKWIRNPKRKFHQLYATMKTLKRGIHENITLIDDNKRAITNSENLKEQLTIFWDSIFTLGLWPEANLKMKRVQITGIIKERDRVDMDREITLKEVNDALDKIQNGKSPGSTNLMNY